jgi:hypothetical protein
MDSKGRQMNGNRWFTCVDITPEAMVALLSVLSSLEALALKF